MLSDSLVKGKNKRCNSDNGDRWYIVEERSQPFFAQQVEKIPWGFLSPAKGRGVYYSKI
jgi:hypothetical protein